ncbi:serine threonine kinase TAO3, putative [Babesia ovata]|uniref:Serine threonine kinase TAO3, putative n=1 Tax=Babesia ovata TaxID=189622 RepID=A0A2H6KJ13_9APIC|nr:serine threonine kinase TAO3, putative [Babesia ovata]GBE62985.1 serine threonine kinase TAO3, putative [Babesia ovata]
MVRVRTPGRFVVPHSQQMKNSANTSPSDCGAEGHSKRSVRQSWKRQASASLQRRPSDFASSLPVRATEAARPRSQKPSGYGKLMRQEAGTAVCEERLQRRCGRAVVTCVGGLPVEGVTLPVGGRHLPTVVALPPALGCGGGTAALGVEEIQDATQAAYYPSHHLQQLVGVGRVVELCGVVGEVDGVGIGGEVKAAAVALDCDEQQVGV